MNMRQYKKKLVRASSLSSKIAKRDLKTAKMRVERDRLVDELGEHSARTRPPDGLLIRSTFTGPLWENRKW